MVHARDLPKRAATDIASSEQSGIMLLKAIGRDETIVLTPSGRGTFEESFFQRRGKILCLTPPRNAAVHIKTCAFGRNSPRSCIIQGLLRNRSKVASDLHCRVTFNPGWGFVVLPGSEGKFEMSQRQNQRSMSELWASFKTAVSFLSASRRFGAGKGPKPIAPGTLASDLRWLVLHAVNGFHAGKNKHVEVGLAL